jgi:hypothetical protein
MSTTPSVKPEEDFPRDGSGGIEISTIHVKAQTKAMITIIFILLIGIFFMN